MEDIGQRTTSTIMMAGAIVVSQVTCARLAATGAREVTAQLYLIAAKFAKVLAHLNALGLHTALGVVATSRDPELPASMWYDWIGLLLQGVVRLVC